MKVIGFYSPPLIGLHYGEFFYWDSLVSNVREQRIGKIVVPIGSLPPLVE